MKQLEKKPSHFIRQKSCLPPIFKIRYFKTTHVIALSFKKWVGRGTYLLSLNLNWFLCQYAWIRSDQKTRQGDLQFTYYAKLYLSWRNKREVGKKVFTYLGCLPVWGKLELGCCGAPTPESKCRSRGTPFFRAWLHKQPGAWLPVL